MPARILIAEDDSNIVLSLEFLLQSAGYEVAVARDGNEALHIAECATPDLIVLDIMLPLLDGFEVCRRIRANPAFKNTRILMLTARGRESGLGKSLVLGADDYMTKPFSTRELAKKIGELLKPASPR